MFLPSPRYITAFLLLSTLSVSSALSLPRNRHSNLTSPNDLSFRITIAAAVHYIHTLYPSAYLTRIECTSPHYSTLTPYDLTDLSLFFRNPSPQRSDHSTILLASRPSAPVWGQWASPQYIPQPRPQEEIGLGNTLTSDILQIVRLMRQAGQHGMFDAVEVVREQGMREDWWIFQMSADDEGWVWVGDESGRVMIERKGE
ncbi:hypothetical protein G7Y79_00061g093220 [Physcia stellaris]|nr:hypothetical protein G7Y79_00061g093220 [Physcia stellaris]